MSRRLGFILSAVLVSAVPTVNVLVAQPSTGDPSKDRVICKNRQATGTRVANRQCRTLRHWEEMAEAAKRNAAEMVNRPVIETRRE